MCFSGSSWSGGGLKREGREADAAVEVSGLKSQGSPTSPFLHTHVALPEQ